MIKPWINRFGGGGAHGIVRMGRSEIHTILSVNFERKYYLGVIRVDGRMILKKLCVCVE